MVLCVLIGVLPLQALAATDGTTTEVKDGVVITTTQSTDTAAAKSRSVPSPMRKPTAKSRKNIFVSVSELNLSAEKTDRLPAGSAVSMEIFYHNYAFL